MSGEDHYHGPGARRRGHRRQKTRPVTVTAGIAAAATADRQIMNADAELHLLRQVDDFDVSFGSPYRRRSATTAARSLITQVGLIVYC